MIARHPSRRLSCRGWPRAQATTYAALLQISHSSPPPLECRIRTAARAQPAECAVQRPAPGSSWLDNTGDCCLRLSVEPGAGVCYTGDQLRL